MCKYNIELDDIQRRYEVPTLIELRTLQTPPWLAGSQVTPAERLFRSRRKDRAVMPSRMEPWQAGSLDINKNPGHAVHLPSVTRKPTRVNVLALCRCSCTLSASPHLYPTFRHTAKPDIGQKCQHDSAGRRSISTVHVQYSNSTDVTNTHVALHDESGSSELLLEIARTFFFFFKAAVWNFFFFFFGSNR